MITVWSRHPHMVTRSHNWLGTWEALAPHKCSATCGGAVGLAAICGTAPGTPIGVGLSPCHLHTIGNVCTFAHSYAWSGGEEMVHVMGYHVMPLVTVEPIEGQA